MEPAVSELQGEWGDDIGLTVSISGTEARFSDTSSVFKFQHSKDGLLLRGALLTGTTTQPIWSFPWGVERKWARITPTGTRDASWSEVFHQFKHDRLMLWQEMEKAMSSHDFDRISMVKHAWHKGHAQHMDLIQNQRDRLDVGRMLLPGVCIVHRKFGYRGVVIACEPWCNAPASWRAQMGVNGLPHGEGQAFYHCIVDERDRPGIQITFCAEENIEPAVAAFPIQSPLASALLVQCNVLGGYLPGPKLQEALSRQHAGERFKL